MTPWCSGWLGTLQTLILLSTSSHFNHQHVFRVWTLNLAHTKLIIPVQPWRLAVAASTTLYWTKSLQPLSWADYNIYICSMFRSTIHSTVCTNYESTLFSSMGNPTSISFPWVTRGNIPHFFLSNCHNCKDQVKISKYKMGRCKGFSHAEYCSIKDETTHEMKWNAQTKCRKSIGGIWTNGKSRCTMGRLSTMTCSRFITEWVELFKQLTLQVFVFRNSDLMPSSLRTCLAQEASADTSLSWTEARAPTLAYPVASDQAVRFHGLPAAVFPVTVASQINGVHHQFHCIRRPVMPSLFLVQELVTAMYPVVRPVYCDLHLGLAEKINTWLWQLSCSNYQYYHSNSKNTFRGISQTPWLVEAPHQMHAMTLESPI